MDRVPICGDIGCRLANRGAATIDDPNPLHILCVVPFMAHWFPYMRKNRFDLEWGPRIDLVAHFLRDVQDWWLLSNSPFPVETSVAVLLHVFAFDFHATDYATYRGITPQELADRSFDDWAAILRSPLEECAAFLPNRNPEEHAFAVRAMEAILSEAARLWEHSPDPSTDDIAFDCAQWLADQGFVVFRR